MVAPIREAFLHLLKMARRIVRQLLLLARRQWICHAVSIIMSSWVGQRQCDVRLGGVDTCLKGNAELSMWNCFQLKVQSHDLFDGRLQRQQLVTPRQLLESLQYRLLLFH